MAEQKTGQINTMYQKEEVNRCLEWKCLEGGNLWFVHARELNEVLPGSKWKPRKLAEYPAHRGLLFQGNLENKQETTRRAGRQELAKARLSSLACHLSPPSIWLWYYTSLSWKCSSYLLFGRIHFLYWLLWRHHWVQMYNSLLCWVLLKTLPPPQKSN